jgi:hypothetical protein
MIRFNAKTPQTKSLIHEIPRDPYHSAPDTTTCQLLWNLIRLASLASSPLLIEISNHQHEFTSDNRLASSEVEGGGFEGEGTEVDGSKWRDKGKRRWGEFGIQRRFGH